MGCISSKLLSTTDLDHSLFLRRDSAESRKHIVSLTSSTYGVLNLDPFEPKLKEEEEDDDGEEKEVQGATKAWKKCPPPPLEIPSHSDKKAAAEEPPEIINVRELMENLDGGGTPFWTPLKKPVTPKQRAMTPGAVPSPKKQRRKLFGGKENSSPKPGSERSVLDSSRVLKPFSSSENTRKWIGPIPSIQRSTPTEAKVQKCRENSSSRRSLSPFFDPELLDSFERELSAERKQIKKMALHPQPERKCTSTASLLESYEEKCPPGGENAVVLYTTTLRGIRKTFEDCNAVRMAIESYNVQVIERDISMDSGFREGLRELMGRKVVKVPAVFVKGRHIGGAEEVLRIEEEGKLGVLLEGIPPPPAAWCGGCGGLRFMMCMECSGSCKVMDEERKKMVKCGACNENGLVQCPVCC